MTRRRFILEILGVQALMWLGVTGFHFALKNNDIAIVMSILLGGVIGHMMWLIYQTYRIGR